MIGLPHDVILQIMDCIDDQTFLSHQYNLVVRMPQLEERRDQLLEERTRGRVEKICSDFTSYTSELVDAENDDKKSQILYWMIEDLAWQLIPYKEKPVYLYRRLQRTKTPISNLVKCSIENTFVATIIKENMSVDATYRLRPFHRNYLRKNHIGVLALIY